MEYTIVINNICKCKECSLKFNKNCSKHDKSLDEIINKILKTALPHKPNIESVDVISKFVLKHQHYIGIIKINDIEIFRSESQEISQNIVNYTVNYIQEALLNFSKKINNIKE